MKTAIQFFRSVLKYPKNIQFLWGLLFVSEFKILEELLEDLQK